MKTENTNKRYKADDHFGGCPVCHMQDGFLNCNQQHFFVCHEHKKYWGVGQNLFDCWRDENVEIWQANIATLETYQECEPFYPEPPMLARIKNWWRRNVQWRFNRTAPF